MAEAYVVLWTLERCRWLDHVGDRGPLEVIFGGPHTSMPSIDALQVGDWIYPVCVMDGKLCVIAGMRVQSFAPPHNYVQTRLGIDLPSTDMWDGLFAEMKKSKPSVGHRLPFTCADQAAMGERGSSIAFDRFVAYEDLALLHLGPKPGRERPLAGVADGRLTNNFSLQGHVRRLSAESARLFDRLFHQ